MGHGTPGEPGADRTHAPQAPHEGALFQNEADRRKLYVYTGTRWVPYVDLLAQNTKLLEALRKAEEILSNLELVQGFKGAWPETLPAIRAVIEEVEKA